MWRKLIHKQLVNGMDFRAQLNKDFCIPSSMEILMLASSLLHPRAYSRVWHWMTGCIPKPFVIFFWKTQLFSRFEPLCQEAKTLTTFLLQAVSGSVFVPDPGAQVCWRVELSRERELWESHKWFRGHSMPTLMKMVKAQTLVEGHWGAFLKSFSSVG